MFLWNTEVTTMLFIRANIMLFGVRSIAARYSPAKLRKRLQVLIRESAAGHHSEIIELEIMPDHVHLLVEVDPQYGIHRLIKQIKGISSRVLRHEFPKIKSRLPTLWSNSYFVSTVGGAPLAIIKQYIENQKTS